MVACGIPALARVRDHEIKRELAAGMGKIANIRRSGAAALDLAMVACGRFDGYWERGISSWDVAAGIACAGGEAAASSAIFRAAQTCLARARSVQGNQAIYRQLLDLMRKA